MATLCSSFMSFTPFTPLIDHATKCHIFSVNNSLYKQTIFSLSQLSIPYMRNKIRNNSITACLPLYGKANYQQVLHRPGPANFPRSPWKSQDFGSYESETNMFAKETIGIADLKEEVRSMILSFAFANDPYQELDLIDKIQRLGIAYHFQEEIKTAYNGYLMLLKLISQNQKLTIAGAELHEPALGHVPQSISKEILAGYFISPDVFNKFKDDSGNFQSKLTSDIQCILSLYEASNLGYNGETTMDEAMEFTRKHLTSMVSRVSPWHATELQHALDIPLQKTVTRIEAKRYISTYEGDESHNQTLLELAKLDYNRVQLIHRKELNEVTKWWEDMNIQSKLPFEVRDRVVESYAILLTVYFEPQYSFGRKLMAKCNMLLTVLDDAFDMYGNLEELAPLVDAFQRWDSGVINKSPEYIKVIFREVDDLIHAVDKEMRTRPQQFNGLDYLKQEFKDYTQGLMNEAKVLFSKDMPTLEEWLPISKVTMAINIFMVSAIMDLREVATKDVYDWVTCNPKIIDSCYLIYRLWDDIGTFKWEHDRGITLSTVTCCMNDLGISEAEAIKHIQKMISTSWKNINQELLRPNPVPISVLKIAFNLAQIMETYFAGGNDGFTNINGRTKDLISFMFVDPV